MLRARETPLPNKRPRGLKKGAKIIVTDDGNGLSFAVASRLDAEGFVTEIATKGERVAEDADGVVYLSGVRDFADIDAAMGIPLDAFRAAKRVAPRFSTRGGLFVAVQDTGGAFATDEWGDPNKSPTGGLSGLAKTAALEWPNATVRSIDIDAGHRDSTEVAEELVREIMGGGDDVEIGLPEGKRIALDLVLEPSPGPRLESPLGEGDVVVVSGGARGVTAACVLELGRRTGARFLLLGRSPLPELDELESIEDDAELKRALLARAKSAGEKISPADLGKRAGRIRSAAEIRGTLSDFAALGLEARYVSVDVRDAAALYGVLDEVRDAWGPIRGLVHGAGVIRDRNIVDKTEDQFETVFDTKVHGLWALLAATAGDPLSVVCVFSSVAGRAGNVGQVDYSMANEVISKMTQIEARRRPDAVVKSIAWGPWDGGMVGPSLRKVFEERGIVLIPVDVGARMFADELLGDSSDVEIVVGSVIEVPDEETASKDEEPSEVANGTTEKTFSLDAKSHGFLLDHSIDGTPVLPLVVAIDFFIAALEPWFAPEEVAVEDIHVRHGVRLHDLESGETIKVTAHRISNGIDGARMELFDSSGELAYTARARRVVDEAHDGLDVDSPEEVFEDVVYDGKLLFHGRTLQVLHDVRKPDERGMKAAVKRGSQVGVGTGEYKLDPATMDGAMQLAVLWTANWVEGLSLPLKVERFRKYGPFDGDLSLRLRGRKKSRSSAVSDVDVVNQAGELVASLRGIEVYKYRTR